MTAFHGDALVGDISPFDKLGGLSITQVSSSDTDAAFISKEMFQKVDSAHTMLEVYGSDMTGFSSGGFVWAAEMEVNILCPRANLVGSYYSGTI